VRLKFEEQRFDDWAAALFDQPLLAEGGQLDDPVTFIKRVNQLMMEFGSNWSRLCRRERTAAFGLPFCSTEAVFARRYWLACAARRVPQLAQNIAIGGALLPH
jgi:hypothetical protein